MPREVLSGRQLQRRGRETLARRHGRGFPASAATSRKCHPVWGDLLLAAKRRSTFVNFLKLPAWMLRVHLSGR